MVEFIVGEGERRKISFVTNIPEEVLTQILDMAKDVLSEDIQRFMAEFAAQNTTNEKPPIALDELADRLRGGGYSCNLAGAAILVSTGRMYSRLPQDKYIANVSIAGKGAKIDSARSEQAGAIENLADYIVRQGFTSVEIHSSDVKSATHGS